MTGVERHPATEGAQTATSRDAEPATAGDAESAMSADAGPITADAGPVRTAADKAERTVTLVANTARESLASVKALTDALRRPPPLIDSPPDPAIANALRN
jgi:hypothetical protein